jgi:hypothetical protein
MTHRFFLWFFQNRETGAITIAQAPNGRNDFVFRATPGGTVEPSETVLAAAKLGIREELAIDFGTPGVLSLCRLATVSGGDEDC